MKFQPREMGEAAEASSGGGRRGVLRELTQLTLLSAAVIAGIWLISGGIAQIAVRWISPEQESELLDELLPELELWKPDSPGDVARKETLDRVLQKLASHQDVPDLDFRIILIDERAPNAFAFPGGVIGVTRGLLDALGDEEIAYAFVIGHELGHFKNRDHLHRLVRQLGTGTALSLIFGTSGGMSMVGNVNEMLQLDFSREQEEAADAFALQLVKSTYGETTGSERLFEKLNESHSLPAWAYMFTTHPDTAGRIRKIREK